MRTRVTDLMKNLSHKHRKRSKKKINITTRGTRMLVQEAISRTCSIISILIWVPTVYLLNIYQYFTTLFACPNGNIFGTLLPSPDFTLRKLESFGIKVSCNK